jgi:hypothetical protein
MPAFPRQVWYTKGLSGSTSVAVQEEEDHLDEMFDLEPLAADYAEDGVYEFMFAAPPLTSTGGVGSPINPQASKQLPLGRV